MTTNQTKTSRRYGVRKTTTGKWGVLDTATGWFRDARGTRAAAANLAKILNRKEVGL